MSDSHDPAHGFKTFSSGAPSVIRARNEYNSAALDGATALSKKTKELVAVAAALTAQCEGCLEHHATGALAAGASQEELAETVHVAGALRGGDALYRGLAYVMPNVTDGSSARQHATYGA